MRRFNPIKHYLAAAPAPAGHLRGSHSKALNAAGPVACLLESRSVIRFSGPDTLKFLQGVVTNDVRRFGESSPPERTSTIPTPNMPAASKPPMYAAMVNPNGRFVYDFFFYKPAQAGQKLDPTGSGPGSAPGGSNELFADVHEHALEEILSKLKRLKLRAEVEIEDVSENFRCWQRFGGGMGEKSRQVEEPEAASVGWGSGVDRVGMSASHGERNGWQWYKDPRLECLGFRGIFPYDTTPPLVEADKETNEENYVLWRVEKGVAEGPIEIPSDKAIALEYNLEGLNAISFDKGCYIGQEFIARTHHRGVIRKRLVPLKFVDDHGKEVEQQVAVGSQVVDAGTGKQIGSVTTAIGCRGLGVLKLDDAFTRTCSMVIEGQENVKVKARKPEWWPPEWHQGQTAVA